MLLNGRHIYAYHSFSLLEEHAKSGQITFVGTEVVANIRPNKPKVYCWLRFYFFREKVYFEQKVQLYTCYIDVVLPELMAGRLCYDLHIIRRCCVSI